MVRLTDSAAVLALWWIALALAVLVIVPLAVYLLHRTWKAARSIRRFTAETLAAGRGIAEHTGKIQALESTLEIGGPIVEKTGRLRTAASELESVLRSRSP